MTGTLDITGKQIVRFLRYALFVIGTAIFAAGAVTRGWNIMFWGLFVFFLSNIFFGFDRGSIRFIFLFFHLAVFTFLIVLARLTASKTTTEPVVLPCTILKYCRTVSLLIASAPFCCITVSKDFHSFECQVFLFFA